MVGLSNFCLKGKNMYRMLSTSTAGLLFRRGPLSGLYLLSYSHLWFWLCLAIVCGRIDFFFVLLSGILIGILMPFYFILVCVFFLLGLFGINNILTSFVLMMWPSSIVFFFIKILILFGLCLVFFFFFKFILKFIFLSIEHTIRFFFFLIGVLIYSVCLAIRHEPILYLLYHLILEISGWIYVFIVFFWLKLKSHNWYIYILKKIRLSFFFVVVFFYKALSYILSNNMNDKIWNKMEIWFYKNLLEVKHLKSVKDGKFSFLFDSLKFMFTIDNRKLVLFEKRVKDRRNLREKANNMSKLYLEMQKYKDSTVEDIYTHLFK